MTNPQDTRRGDDRTRKYFRSRILGNFCENCQRVFEEGDIIHTPEQVAFDGTTITRFFCVGSCSLEYRNKLSSL